MVSELWFVLPIWTAIVMAPKAMSDKAPGKSMKMETEEEEAVLRLLHLQGSPSGTSGHRHLLQGHVHYELLSERHFRSYCG